MQITRNDIWINSNGEIITKENLLCDAIRTCIGKTPIYTININDLKISKSIIESLLSKLASNDVY